MINAFRSGSSLVVAAACLCWAVFGAPVQAQTPSPADWIEAADACERLIADGDKAGFQNYKHGEPRTIIRSIKEQFFYALSSSLSVETLVIGDDWTLCAITSTPHVNPTEELVAAWTQHQIQRANDENSILLDYKNGNSFEPARVRCRDGDVLVVVTAVNYGGQEFRAVVNDDLPDWLNDPCVQNIGS
ncbi:MAG: hypothetical protein AAFZ02_07160 [Pseudomonadota bacterium]